MGWAANLFSPTCSHSSLTWHQSEDERKANACHLQGSPFQMPQRERWTNCCQFKNFPVLLRKESLISFWDSGRPFYSLIAKSLKSRDISLPWHLILCKLYQQAFVGINAEFPLTSLFYVLPTESTQTHLRRENASLRTSYLSFWYLTLIYFFWCLPSEQKDRVAI